MFERNRQFRHLVHITVKAALLLAGLLSHSTAILAAVSTATPKPAPTPNVEVSSAPAPSATPSQSETATTAPSPSPSPAPQVKAAKMPRIIFKKFVVAASIESETVQLTAATQVTMSGLSPIARFSYFGNLDSFGSPKLKSFTWEAGLGGEDLKTTGTLPSAACQGSSNCVFDIPSITVFGRLGWRPFDQRFGAPEFRIGGDLLFPVSVTSNVITYSAFTPLFFATVGIAARHQLSEKAALPFGVDLAGRRSSNGTTLNRFIIYAGYSWQ